MKHLSKFLFGLFVLQSILNASCEIEDKMYFASVRNRFNEFVGCATIISPSLAITAASVVKGKRPEELFVTLGNHNESNVGYLHLPEIYFERVMETYLNEIKNKTGCEHNETDVNHNHTVTNAIDIAEADFKVTAMRKLLGFSSVTKIPTSHIRAVEKIVIHPLYKTMGKFESNIAVLHFEHSIKVNDLKPVQMDLEDADQTDYSTLLGWTRYHAYEKNVTIANISECTEITQTNYSSSDFLCIKNPGHPIAGVLGNPCLPGCPLVLDDKLVGMVTAGHKKLSKNKMLLAITKAKILPFVQAIVKGVDFNDWQKDIEGMVEDFVKHVVDKTFF